MPPSSTSSTSPSSRRSPPNTGRRSTRSRSPSRACPRTRTKRSSGGRCPQAVEDHRLDAIGVKRTGEEVTLAEVATQTAELVALRLALDPLGHHDEAERVREIDDRLRERAVVRVGADALHERL